MNEIYLRCVSKQSVCVCARRIRDTNFSTFADDLNFL